MLVLPEIGVSAGILVGMRKGFIRQGGRLKNSSGECLTEASDGPRRGEVVIQKIVGERGGADVERISRNKRDAQDAKSEIESCFDG